MLMRYLKCQLFVFLFGGIVGPIFLVIGLAGLPVVGEMFFWLGLAITIIDVIVAVVWANLGAKSAAKTEALEASGVLAVGRIMGMGETGTRINDVPLVKLRLRVEGPGITPFDTEDSVLAQVTRMPILSRGSVVVLVDPATNQYQIDWTRSALISGMVPAQFTLAEDGRTYDLSGQVGPLMEIMHILKANGVPMDGTIDIRSNPVVRQQVMNVARRAASQQGQGQAPSAPPLSQPAAPVGYPAAAPQPSVSQRLQELETLRATGAVSEEEYTAKRQQILAGL
ncbi:MULTISPECIES: SHOCT domain-containing protein [unclassified Mycobacterium]|uniref:SHOCT domain-containing protein n=1 Tax=unclassified Mycobacterium TaxID=2642494 RepID=UPI0029C6971B|nr:MULTISPECIES: SHOCT domain-containing protein [unclassified Mycobacterium]